MACREPTDAAQGSEDGTQRDGGCCAVRWRMACRGSKDGSPEASGWCMEGRRVANRRRLGAIFSPLELYPISAKGLFIRQNGFAVHNSFISKEKC